MWDSVWAHKCASAEEFSNVANLPKSFNLYFSSFSCLHSLFTDCQLNSRALSRSSPVSRDDIFPSCFWMNAWHGKAHIFVLLNTPTEIVVAGASRALKIPAASPKIKPSKVSEMSLIIPSPMPSGLSKPFNVLSKHVVRV